MISRLNHKEGAQRAQGKSARFISTFPYWRIPILECELSEVIEHHKIGPLPVVGAAYQCNVALSGADAQMGDPHGIDSGRFFAHESAGGSCHSVHDRDVARQQV